VITFLMVGGIPKWEGRICFWDQEIRQHNVGLIYRKNVALCYGCSVPMAE